MPKGTLARPVAPFGVAAHQALEDRQDVDAASELQLMVQPSDPPAASAAAAAPTVEDKTRHRRDTQRFLESDPLWIGLSIRQARELRRKIAKEHLAMNVRDTARRENAKAAAASMKSTHHSQWGKCSYPVVDAAMLRVETMFKAQWVLLFCHVAVWANLIPARH